MDTELHYIFGYGSIMWRPDFPFESVQLGYASNWKRQFSQWSPDHRGTSSRPGLVVTLVPAMGSRCAGLLFGVTVKDFEAVVERLDRRESHGYERHQIDVFTESSAFSALTYVAPAENEFDAGVLGWVEMTDIIRGAAGPSGSNLNYVAKLHETLTSHEITDPYVNQLVAHLNSETH